MFFVIGAVLLGASKMGLIDYHFGIWQVVATVFFGGIFLRSLLWLAFPGIFFSAAFLAMIYAKPLGIGILVPWTVLGIALLLTIGFSIIFGPFRWKRYGNDWSRHGHGYQHNWHYQHSGSDTDEVVNIENKFGTNIRYVRSTNLKQINIQNTMGETKVYLDQVKVNDSNEVLINVDVSLGGIELYIPSDWKVDDETNLVMGTIEKDGPHGGDSVVKAIVQGQVKMGGIKVVYG
ncbi:hypothetical protein PECL_455 [Pediococcus claussenii ATCC BAA-344]|uniref:Cell wall-active antibiotics response LiaF-like C-terminal domain-containing protein n=1 Tax=Pediococcus claussenii (strain ATCC BAA-344 / DSM 14800 / JCM 18046 / KCTC 3811 / LMG 21948 / P06) TaxID=701521 RepID=G8PBK9_PEDCP|nr:hypothetical protein PECL_455 [Pediococcus claussenii ATCC BAA-344]ANZ69954.1 hypothetical protein AYR57_06345 [Pediococcus claussenii]ANZ71770.1 hypothetical protein AYR58_06345 [Pediococcus claussenii]KRN20937.1 hypothetical protein IV79_GL000162 [Pediococcus claussenii]